MLRAKPFANRWDLSSTCFNPRPKPAARYFKCSASPAFALPLRSRYSELSTLSILCVKSSLPLAVSADATTPRSLSLETRPLISCLRYAPPNRRSDDCKMTVGGIFVGPFGPQKCHPQTLLIACYGDKVIVKLKLRDEESRRRFFIFGTTPAVSHQKESESHSRF